MESKLKTYLIGSASMPGMFKIGTTKDLKKRLCELQVACPYELEIYASGEEMLEQELYELFQGARIRGEWFNFSKEELFIVISLIETGDVDR